MRPLRRHHDRERPAEGPQTYETLAVVHPVPGTPEAGAEAALISTAEVDLVVAAPGIIVSSTGNGPQTVPVLTPWSEVVGASASGPAALPDGSMGRVITVELIPGSDLTTAVPTRYVLPSTDVDPFLAAVGAGATPPAPTPVLHNGHTVAGRAAAAWAVAVGWAASVRSRGSDPEHGLGKRRVGPIVIGLLALILLAGSGRGFESAAGGDPTGQGGGAQIHAQEVGNGLQASRVNASVTLPQATSTPAPAPPSLASSAPLQSHEIFGYAPYWTLPQSNGFDVNDLTTLAYFSVDANGNGTLNESGAGWNGYESQDLVNLVTRSHAAGDRVVLTVTCFSQSSLDAITSDPNAPATLSAALISAVSAKNLDGVNFDFEGEGSGDRNGLTSLITQVSNSLHAANPHWQVTMATYASAAGDASGFYNVAALAPALDGFFVMAYDMNNRSSPSPTAPLVGGGYSDTEALQQFTSVVPASKVILGVPYYGYDWPTTDGTNAAKATGGESPLSYAVIAASGHPTYWDPATQTPWTAYQVGTQWHETYFDDPTSLALKAQLANSFHIAGLGIWALGMDGNDPANLAALLETRRRPRTIRPDPRSPCRRAPASPPRRSGTTSRCP